MNKAIIFLSIVLILAMAAMGAYIWQNEQDKSALREELAQTEITKTVFEEPEVTQTPTAQPSTSSAETLSTGTITGSVSYPSEVIPAMQICAENTITTNKYCTDGLLKDAQFTNSTGYRLDVPEGSYTVYAKLPNDSYKAYYSEFVTCGLNVSCSSHEPITIVVTAGATTDKVDPQDWYNQ